MHICSHAFICAFIVSGGGRPGREEHGAVRPLQQRGNDNNNESNKWLKVQHSCGEILHFDGEGLDWAHGPL